MRMGAFCGGTVIVNQTDRVVVSGSSVIPFHKEMKGQNITTINGRCYIDGFELVNGKWKKTFKAWWHKTF
ncbi:hypothetical protein CN357_21215 [Bacillus cereus]|uniref:Uncharacterized protein n=2 Tax=Bacillaceae TaxID=186817 RepID=A0A9X0MKS0_BACCE|nr:hypothetical protein AT268_32690 [Bacillus cereus]PEZ75472.1 hypothetical protein CN410_15165 [Bacillus anthracis]PGB07087.1 hypothetical protein COM09_31690 [Bacillus toyonensis]PES55721.1 hypothetical protein CN515_03780 [Bacillus cereus]PFF46200.1 hypothetical protein CN357_21215 [Bacillus cereus]